MRTPATACALLAAAACSADVPNTIVVTRTDSAAVELVALSSSPWSEAQVPDLFLGEPLTILTSDDPPLFRISDAAWTAGGIAVANASSGQVLFFDESGSLQAVIGGRGEGPGEFSSLVSVFAWQGDSVGTFDATQRRVSFFGPDGTLGRSLNVRVAGNQWVRVEAASTDKLLMVRGDQPSGEPGIRRPRVQLLLLDPDGTEVASLGDFPGNTVFSNDAGMGGVIMGPGLAFAAKSGRVVVGDGALPAVNIFDAAGQLSQVIRWTDQDRSLSPSFSEQLLEETLKSVPEAARDQARALFERLPVADSVPTLRDVLLGRDGRIWVGAHPVPESLDPEIPSPPQAWFVLSRSGELEARVVAPRGVTLVAVDQDRLLAIHRGADGAETVRVYRLP